MKANGFTLVELLVVIAVMALLAAGVVLSLPEGGTAARDAAGRFAAGVAAARDTAVLTGRPTGVWISPSGYGFEQFAGGEWRAFEAKPLAQEDWGREVRATLAGQARVRFDSVGLPDRTFDLRLDRAGRAATVRIAADGAVAVP